MTPPREYHLVPPDSLRCIWMTAGILSYRLCDRAYECDDCPLDAGIRGQARDRGQPAEVDLPPAEPGTSRGVLREGLRYSRNHCWIQERSSRLMRVGLEPGLSAVLLPPRSIVFLSEGQSLQIGQTCLWIRTEGGTLALDSPVGGTVRRSNDRLIDLPSLLHLQPFDEGWLFEVETEESGGERTDLMDSSEAQGLYARRESRFAAQLSRALHARRPSAGIAPGDGGRRLQDIANLLGSTQYFAVVRRTYGS